MYTEKKTINGGRKKLLNKSTFTAIRMTSDEWQKALCECTYAYYDLGTTNLLVVGGDGGSWVQNSFDLLGIKRVEKTLDKHHINKAIKMAFRVRFGSIIFHPMLVNAYSDEVGNVELLYSGVLHFPDVRILIN